MASITPLEETSNITKLRASSDGYFTVTNARSVLIVLNLLDEVNPTGMEIGDIKIKTLDKDSIFNMTVDISGGVNRTSENIVPLLQNDQYNSIIGALSLTTRPVMVTKLRLSIAPKINEAVQNLRFKMKVFGCALTTPKPSVTTTTSNTPKHPCIDTDYVKTPGYLDPQESEQVRGQPVLNTTDLRKNGPGADMRGITDITLDYSSSTYPGVSVSAINLHFSNEANILKVRLSAFGGDDGFYRSQILDWNEYKILRDGNNTLSALNVPTPFNMMTVFVSLVLRNVGVENRFHLEILGCAPTTNGTTTQPTTTTTTSASTTSTTSQPTTSTTTSGSTTSTTSQPSTTTTTSAPTTITTSQPTTGTTTSESTTSTTSRPTTTITTTSSSTTTFPTSVSITTTLGTTTPPARQCILSTGTINQLTNRTITQVWVERDGISGYTGNDVIVNEGQAIEQGVTIHFMCGRCNCTVQNTLSCMSDKSCAKDCVWSPWEPWSNCEGPCQNAQQRRTRSIASGAERGGRECEASEREETRSCESPNCRCEWSQWGPWSSCSETCGGGQKVRSRSKLNEACQSDRSPSRETETCNTDKCPDNSCDGNKIHYTCYNSTCPKTCGDYQGTSVCNENDQCKPGCFCPQDMVEDDTGNCTKPKDCQCDLAKANCNDCETAACVNGKIECSRSDNCDCKWNDWTDWSPCDKVCGPGKSRRTRQVSTPRRGSGAACVGNSTQERPCETRACPVCKDSNNVTYNPGEAMLTDDVCKKCYCDEQGSKQCQDKSTGELSPPTYGDWSSWSDCSRNCGGGTRTKTRTCIKVCTNQRNCNETLSQSQPCNEQICSVDCLVGEWTNSTSCSAVCDGTRGFVEGTVRQTRAVVRQPIGSGQACPELERVLVCNKTCTVDCRVNTYSEGTCTKSCQPGDQSCNPTCGIGTMIKTPANVVPAQNGGAPCEPRVEPCNLGECSNCTAPKENTTCKNTCELTCASLSTLSQCTARECAITCACPPGFHEQDGTCVPRNQCRCTWNPTKLGPKPAGISNEVAAGFVVRKECNNCTCVDGEWSCTGNQCNVDCEWGDWYETRPCDAECGNGTKVVSRQIQRQKQYNGADCTGPSTRSEPCTATQPCCGQNIEQFNANINCERTCDDVANGRGASQTCAAGCRCKVGYVRRNGTCVPEQECLKCIINGNVVPEGTTVKNVSACKVQYCERSELKEKPLDASEIPACTDEDANLAQQGETKEVDAERCCYKAVLRYCRPTSVPLEHVYLEDGNLCKIPASLRATQTVCAGGCASRKSLRFLAKNNAQAYYNSLKSAGNNAMPGLSFDSSCNCCTATQYTVREPVSVTCEHSVTKATKTIQYVPIDAARCQCQVACPRS